MTTATAIELGAYTDPAPMRALLQAQLPGYADGGLHIDALAVHQVLRNTSRTRNPCAMTLCYELQVSDPVQGRRGLQWLYAQVYRGGQAASAHAQQDAARLVRPAFGEALVHLPTLDLLVWALPNDPGLPQLPTLLDPAEAARLLPGTVTGAVQVELLRYTPLRRATLRYTIDGGAGGAAASRTLYAKTFCDDRAALLHERFDYFWQLAQHDAQAPRVAPPLGHHAGTGSLWQAPAQGTPLLHCLTPAQAPKLLARVAIALARLHAAPLRPSPAAAPRTVAHWLAEVQRRRRKIGRIDTAWAARAARIADAIEAHAPGPGERPLGLIHGDFHPEQVWVHEDRIVLFDFDEFTLGDPMEDLAEFLLKLEQAGVAGASASALVEQYAAAAPQRFDRASLAWHLAIQSLLQASRAFVYQTPGWATLLERRLAASEAYAAALFKPRTP